MRFFVMRSGLDVDEKLRNGDARAARVARWWGVYYFAEAVIKNVSLLRWLGLIGGAIGKAYEASAPIVRGGRMQQATNAKGEPIVRPAPPARRY